MMPVRCFMLEPTSRREIEFRRYGGTCSAKPYGMPCHEARMPGGFDSLSREENGVEPVPELEPKDVEDWRWGKVCDGCGQAFDEETRQVNPERIYRRLDTGEECTLRDPLVGAMWDSTREHGFEGYGGPDRLVLHVVVPGGAVWCIDGPSNTGSRWTRTGTPPAITASPSIQTHNWHGFLERGWLVEQRAQAPA